MSVTENSTDIDPNQQYETSIGPDHPNLSEAELYAEKENPVRETPTPFGALRNGGGSAT